MVAHEDAVIGWLEAVLSPDELSERDGFGYRGRDDFKAALLGEVRRPNDGLLFVDGEWTEGGS